MQNKLALVTDFDGTISNDDFFDLVADTYLSPDALEPWQLYLQGKLSHIEALAEVFAQIRIPEKELLAFIDEIPVDDARELMTLCQGGIIDKTRYIVPASSVPGSVCHYRDGENPAIPDRKWEVDVFHGDNEGLVMAEIELGSEDETFDRPSWLGEEVTGDRRYYNSMLSEHPFSVISSTK